jgi:REP element-mobilizing transposase RayT
VNSFEYVTTETEQAHLEQKELQTILRASLPVSAPEGKLEEQTVISNPALEVSIKEEVRVPLSIPALETILEVESPSTGTGDSQIVELESIQQISYELSYSCLLIPRFSDHYLSGDITEDLPRWIKEICISYGWRLGAIMIRPGYFQWIITVPLTASPAQFMRITRQQTSLKILEDYPRFKRQNLSGDFWAPGFSVAPGNQFQSMESVNSFILQTRRNQGIS